MDQWYPSLPSGQGPFMPEGWRPAHRDLLGSALPFSLDYLQVKSERPVSAPVPYRQPQDIPIARALSVPSDQAAEDLSEVDWSKVRYDPVTQLTGDSLYRMGGSTCVIGRTLAKQSARAKATPWGFIEKVEIVIEVESYDDVTIGVDD